VRSLARQRSHSARQGRSQVPARWQARRRLHSRLRARSMGSRPARLRVVPRLQSFAPLVTSDTACRFPR
jgi:hypothetical protein